MGGRFYPTQISGYIAPRGYRVISLSPSPLSLSSDGGQILLADPSRERVLDALTYGTSTDVPVGWAYFREPSGAMWSESLTDEPVEGSSHFSILSLPNSLPLPFDFSFCFSIINPSVSHTYSLTNSFSLLLLSLISSNSLFLSLTYPLSHPIRRRGSCHADDMGWRV